MRKHVSDMCYTCVALNMHAIIRILVDSYEMQHMKHMHKNSWCCNTCCYEYSHMWFINIRLSKNMYFMYLVFVFWTTQSTSLCFYVFGGLWQQHNAIPCVSFWKTQPPVCVFVCLVNCSNDILVPLCVLFCVCWKAYPNACVFV